MDICGKQSIKETGKTKLMSRAELLKSFLINVIIHRCIDTLTIQDLSMNNLGNYSCAAQNSIGRNRTNIELPGKHVT